MTGSRRRCAFLCVMVVCLTVSSPAWLESVFGVDPDGGSGAVEALIAGLVIAGLILAMIARHWRTKRVTKARLDAV